MRRAFAGFFVGFLAGAFLAGDFLAGVRFLAAGLRVVFFAGVFFALGTFLLPSGSLLEQLDGVDVHQLSGNIQGQTVVVFAVVRLVVLDHEVA